MATTVPASHGHLVCSTPSPRAALSVEMIPEQSPLAARDASWECRGCGVRRTTPFWLTCGEKTPRHREYTLRGLAQRGEGEGQAIAGDGGEVGGLYVSV